MNFSGNILYNFLSFNFIQYYSILIVHDDLDLLVGDIKLKFSSTTSSHNGISSIISFLKTSDFFRLRIGIGNNFSVLRKKYVLSEPSYSEKVDILRAIKCSIFCIDDILSLNFSRFRNNFLFLFNSGGIDV
jgi:PTH1 family peptidyl-tRNA hydrolase